MNMDNTTLKILNKHLNIYNEFIEDTTREITNDEKYIISIFYCIEKNNDFYLILRYIHRLWHLSYYYSDDDDDIKKKEFDFENDDCKEYVNIILDIFNGLIENGIATDDYENIYDYLTNLKIPRKDIIFSDRLLKKINDDLDEIDELFFIDSKYKKLRI